jgi:hypothetical protein
MRRRKGAVIGGKVGLLEPSEVVHTAIAIVQLCDYVPRTPRNQSFQVGRPSIGDEDVRQNFVGRNIFDLSANDIRPLGALRSGLAEPCGSDVKAPPHVQGKALANLTCPMYVEPSIRHALPLELRRVPPRLGVAPWGAISDLLANRFSPELFFKIREGLTIQSGETRFACPKIGKLTMIEGGIASPNVIDLIRPKHFELGRGLPSAVKQSDVHRRVVGGIRGDEHLLAGANVNSHDVIPLNAPV